MMKVSTDLKKSSPAWRNSLKLLAYAYLEYPKLVFQMYFHKGEAENSLQKPELDSVFPTANFIALANVVMVYSLPLSYVLAHFEMYYPQFLADIDKQRTFASRMLCDYIHLLITLPAVYYLLVLSLSAFLTKVNRLIFFPRARGSIESVTRFKALEVISALNSGLMFSFVVDSSESLFFISNYFGNGNTDTGDRSSPLYLRYASEFQSLSITSEFFQYWHLLVGSWIFILFISAFVHTVTKFCPPGYSVRKYGVLVVLYQVWVLCGLQLGLAFGFLFLLLAMKQFGWRIL